MILKRKIYLLCGDIAIIIISLNLSFLIRLKKSIINYLGLNEAVIIIILISFISLISFYSFDLYDIKEKLPIRKLSANIIGALILIFLVYMALFYIFPYVIGRGVFLIGLSFIGTMAITWRLLYSSLFRLTFPERNIVIVGTGKPAQSIYSILNVNSEYNIVGFIEEEPAKKHSSNIKILGNSLSLEKIIKDHNVNAVIVAKPYIRNKNFNRELIKIKMKGVSIYDFETFYEYSMQKLPIKYIEERWLLYSNGFDKLGSKTNKRIKRVIDIAISTILILIFSPIGIIISFLIKITSEGPIFFLQERVGENNKVFKIIKFRTMVKNAETKEPKWAEENDHRITAIGKILRRSRLDELPQLLNVIKGEMSLVGPRPEREFFINKLIKKIPFYSLRFSVKPGLTGWAQINYPYGASEEDALEKLQYELYYIKNMSLLLDLKILLRTFRVVLFGMGR